MLRPRLQRRRKEKNVAEFSLRNILKRLNNKL